MAYKGPQLPEAHRELRPAVDEHDLVVVTKQTLELDGGGDAPEAAAENECSRHAAGRARATTSASVGANVSTNACTRDMRSLNSSWAFQP